jgi:hypothetical protein
MRAAKIDANQEAVVIGVTVGWRYGSVFGWCWQGCT